MSLAALFGDPAFSAAAALATGAAVCVLIRRRARKHAFWADPAALSLIGALAILGVTGASALPGALSLGADQVWHDSYYVVPAWRNVLGASAGLVALAGLFVLLERWGFGGGARVVAASGVGLCVMGLLITGAAPLALLSASPPSRYIGEEGGAWAVARLVGDGGLAIASIGLLLSLVTAAAFGVARVRRVMT